MAPRTTRAGRPAPDPAPPPSPALTPRTTAGAPATLLSAAAPCATAAGTRRYAERFERGLAADFYRPLGGGGGVEGRVTVASLGLGTYLGECTDEDDARYEAAVRRALAGGCNLLDTAINYRCQRSERAVGRALARAVAEGVVRRDEVVVCTKGGFVPLDGAPPPTREAYDAYLEREFFARGVMAPADVARGGHSMAPSFLRDQVARSRANLGVDVIDVYYLHDPEQQLEVLGPEAFRAALRAAFETLEECVARGVIARYGVATWRAFRVPPGARGHLALAEVAALAREAAGGEGHHLAAVQLPLSLAMPEAVREPTQPVPGRPASRRPVTLLQAAHDLGLAVVASAPLMQGQLARGLAAALRGALPPCETDAQRAVEFVRRMPGVTAALVGMRSAEHVAENLRGAATAL